MALHKRERILAEMATTLTGLAATGSNITRGRVYTIDDSQLPHLSIYQGADEPITPDGVDEATNIYLGNQFEVEIEIKNDASSGILDTQINQICKEIIIALMVDPTRGGLALNTIEAGVSAPELSKQREKRTATTIMRFIIQYRRLRTDPSE